MLEFLEDLFKELEAFAAWLWNKYDPPARKPWCAAFYFVAQQDATLDYPETSLDQKMADAVSAVRSAAAAVDDNVHVVYRTIPGNPLSADPVAKVVRFLGPETGTIFFPDCYETSPLSLVDTAADLACFLKWVYRWCPADHYAIFIWGHSFGPAGLFEPGSGVQIPKPGLTALREAFEEFQKTRVAGDGPPPRPPSADKDHETTSPSTTPTWPTGVLQQWALDGEKKVEIVLFQDCWMSTLETGFEIADSTRLMVASQSLIPLGSNYANFMWPYDDLLKALTPTSNAFAEDMTRRIVKFYVDNFDKVQYLPTIPVTLCDLSTVPALKTPMSDLVTALMALPASQRFGLLEPARIAKLDQLAYPPVLLYGDGALLDMPTLCQGLQADPTSSLGLAAGQLETALQDLVKFHVEAHPSSATDKGFQGVSIFHWPPVGVDSDDFITEAVRRSVAAYSSLQFVTQTQWHQLALEHKPS